MPLQSTSGYNVGIFLAKFRKVKCQHGGGGGGGGENLSYNPKNFLNFLVWHLLLLVGPIVRIFNANSLIYTEKYRWKSEMPWAGVSKRQISNKPGGVAGATICAHLSVPYESTYWWIIDVNRVELTRQKGVLTEQVNMTPFETYKFRRKTKVLAQRLITARSFIVNKFFGKSPCIHIITNQLVPNRGSA